MKLMHLGDLHIGKTLADFDLYEDQKYILDRICDLAVKEGVDGVLIAGDIYDRSIPSESAVSLFDGFLKRLAADGINVYAITGNHDSDERLNFGAGFFETSNIFIYAKYDGTLHKHVLEKDGVRVSIYLMPFIKASQVKHFYPNEDILSYDDAVSLAIGKTDIDASEINILVAHQFVAAIKKTGLVKSTETLKADDSAKESRSDFSVINEEESLPRLSGSEGLLAQNVGLVEMISTESFKDFDYVALGHIHSPQKIGREGIRYSGSPLKYSLSEAGSDKSIPIIEIDINGIVNTEFKKIKPLRDLRHIKGRLDQLLSKENVTDTEDYLYVTLTDDDIINDAMAIFQAHYPNTVRVDYDNKRIRAITGMERQEDVPQRSFSEMIGDFYSKIYGVDISSEELKIMEDIAKETGVLDETC